MKLHLLFSYVALLSMGIMPQAVAKSLEPISKIPRLSEIERPLTKAEFLVQQPQLTQAGGSELVQVIGVRLNQTPSGLEVILETRDGQQLQVLTSSQGDTLIADIPNSQLRLSQGNEFRANNPAEGIAAVTLTNLNANSIQVRVTGVTGVPKVEVSKTAAQGLILSLMPALQTQEVPEAPALQTPEAKPEETPSTTVSQEEEIEIVVTAEKTEENVQDVPISITVVTEQQIEDAGITSLEQVANNTPNFTVFSSGGSRNNVNYSIRGLGNSSFVSREAVAFYIDDVPYDYGGFLSTDLPDLERVEVLRGPQSTLYGRNAQAGVVNIITRKPTNTVEFSAAASYGNYDDLDVQASVSGPLVQDRLFLRLSGNYGSREGYTYNSFLNEDLDNQSGGSGRAQLLWTPSKDLEISLNGSFEEHLDGAYPFIPDTFDAFEAEQDFNGFNNLTSNTQSLRVAYNQPNYRVTSISTRRYSRQEAGVDLDSTSADLFSRLDEFESTVFTQELRLQSPADAQRFQWLVGTYFESKDFNQNASDTTFGTASGPIAGGSSLSRAEVNESIFAIFGQVSYQLFEPLTLSAGLRYESTKSALESLENTTIGADGSVVPGFSASDIEQDRDAWLPRFVMEYRFNPDLMVYGSIARGYKAAGVNFLAPNEEALRFDEERSWNYEVGLKSSWMNNRLFVNLAVFHNPVDNFQVRVLDDNARTFIDNAKVNITGFELEARATPVKGLDVIAGFGYIDGEIDYTNPFTGETLVGLPNAPEYTYNLAVQYRAPSGLFSRVELQGFGTTFFAPLKQGPFAIVNARLGYEFKNYGIYLFGNNILDTEYLTAGVTFPGFGNYVSYGIPATYGVQLKMRF